MQNQIWIKNVNNDIRVNYPAFPCDFTHESAITFRVHSGQNEDKPNVNKNRKMTSHKQQYKKLNVETYNSSCLINFASLTHEMLANEYMTNRKCL